MIHWQHWCVWALVGFYWIGIAIMLTCAVRAQEYPYEDDL